MTLEDNQLHGNMTYDVLEKVIEKNEKIPDYDLKVNPFLISKN